MGPRGAVLREPVLNCSSLIVNVVAVRHDRWYKPFTHDSLLGLCREVWAGLVEVRGFQDSALCKVVFRVKQPVR